MSSGRIGEDISRSISKAKENPLKLILAVMPYLIVAYFINKLGYAYHLIENKNIFQHFIGALSIYGRVLKNPLPSFHLVDLLWGAVGGIVLKLLVTYKVKTAKKFRHGREYGSARWGTEKDMAPYMDHDDPFNNCILTKTEGLKLYGLGGTYGRNKNIEVIGGSGSGKTRFFIKPNLMQMHSSYVVTDPKGTLLSECGKMLADNGYEIKTINTIDFEKSMHYNPFAYIHSEKDILQLVNTLIANTKGEGEKATEDFWVKAERLLYCAYIGYIYYFGTPETQNFESLICMINASETREDDETFQNGIDLMFEELELGTVAFNEKHKDDFEPIEEIIPPNPDNFAVRQYKKYKLAAGKTAKSILISCGARLAPFDIEELRNLTEYDDMELDLLGDRKTALFMIMSDTDPTFNFIMAMMESQLFNLLCDRALLNGNGKLKVHVRCLLDEFANIGMIPNFERLITTIRSREISACIVLQSKAQLKALYKDNAETISGNCDTTLFLGGKEMSTLKEMEEVLGKETIDLYNTSDTRGTSESFGTNYQKTGLELMAKNQLATMAGDECIMQLRGVVPFHSKKYDITKHPNYKLLADENPGNTFDIRQYMDTRYHPQPDDMISDPESLSM